VATGTLLGVAIAAALAACYAHSTRTEPENEISGNPTNEDRAADQTTYNRPQNLDGREIVSGVTFICRILLIGTVLSGIIIWARLLNRGGAVPVADGSVNVPANYAWILFVVLTIGHGIYSRHLVNLILAFWEASDSPDAGRRIFNEIKSTPNMFVFGLIPRVRRRPGTNIYIMERSDPSSVFSHFAAIAFLAAMLPWYVTASGSLRWAAGLALWLPVSVALILIYLNWKLASSWTIVLSQLTLEKPDARLLTAMREHREAVQRNRGFAIGANISRSSGDFNQIFASRQK
jgi:hypothetical protein